MHIMTIVRQKGLLHYLPVIVFVMIVAHHFYWVHQAHLSPWLGGGYGMFSTTDYGPSRYIRIYGLQDDVIQEEIEVPSKFAKQARAVRSLPHDNNILDFAFLIENYLNSGQHGYPVILLSCYPR